MMQREELRHFHWHALPPAPSINLTIASSSQLKDIFAQDTNLGIAIDLENKKWQKSQSWNNFNTESGRQ